jgi:hypothetical protein
MESICNQLLRAVLGPPKDFSGWLDRWCGKDCNICAGDYYNISFRVYSKGICRYISYFLRVKKNMQSPFLVTKISSINNNQYGT